VAVCLAVAFPIYFAAASYSYTGFGIQGRHTLPFIVVLPLLVGEALRRGSARLPARLYARLFAGAALVTGIVQFVAWWTDAHHYAVGANGPWWFFGTAQWSPPGGWAVWALVVGSGSLVLALCWATPSLLRVRRASAAHSE